MEVLTHNPAVNGTTGLVVEAYRTSSAQSVPNATNTAIQFNAEVYDPDGWHDNATQNTRFTVPAGADGDYLAVVQTFWSSIGAGVLVITWGGVNGAVTNWAIQEGTDLSSVIVQTTIPFRGLVAGDYIEAIVQQTAGAAAKLGVDLTRIALYRL